CRCDATADRTARTSARAHIAAKSRARTPSSGLARSSVTSGSWSPHPTSAEKSRAAAAGGAHTRAGRATAPETRSVAPQVVSVSVASVSSRSTAGLPSLLHCAREAVEQLGADGFGRIDESSHGGLGGRRDEPLQHLLGARALERRAGDARRVRQGDAHALALHESLVVQPIEHLRR